MYIVRLDLLHCCGFGIKDKVWITLLYLLWWKLLYGFTDFINRILRGSKTSTQQMVFRFSFKIDHHSFIWCNQPIRPALCFNIVAKSSYLYILISSLCGKCDTKRNLINLFDIHSLLTQEQLMTIVISIYFVNKYIKER